MRRLTRRHHKCAKMYTKFDVVLGIPVSSFIAALMWLARCKESDHSSTC